MAHATFGDVLTTCMSDTITVLPRTSVVTEQSPGLWLVGMALLCLLVLLLPLEGESPSWPSYTHITVNQKLIASFALGRRS